MLIVEYTPHGEDVSDFEIKNWVQSKISTHQESPDVRNLHFQVTNEKVILEVYRAVAESRIDHEQVKIGCKDDFSEVDECGYPEDHDVIEMFNDESYDEMEALHARLKCEKRKKDVESD